MERRGMRERAAEQEQESRTRIAEGGEQKQERRSRKKGEKGQKKTLAI